MAKPIPAEHVRPAPPRLTLVTPAIEDAAAFAHPLAEALEVTDVAAVLLRLTSADERTLVNRIKALAEPVQSRGVALIVAGEPGVAVRGGADGAHLACIEDFLAAVDSLKPARIAGCAGLATRHDAMMAAERGADYVMFGEHHAGRRPSFDAILERVAWWAEVFEVPCVGYAASIREIEPLAKAGADFIALDAAIWSGTNGSAALREAAQRLGALEAAG